MLQTFNRIAKRGAARVLPGMSIAIVIAGVTLSPTANAEPASVRISQATEVTESPEPAAPTTPAPRTKAAKPPAAKAKSTPPKSRTQPDDNVADDLNRREAERVRAATQTSSVQPTEQPRAPAAPTAVPMPPPAHSLKRAAAQSA